MRSLPGDREFQLCPPFRRKPKAAIESVKGCMMATKWQHDHDKTGDPSLLWGMVGIMCFLKMQVWSWEYTESWEISKCQKCLISLDFFWLCSMWSAPERVYNVLSGWCYWVGTETAAVAQFLNTIQGPDINIQCSVQWSPMEDCFLLFEPTCGLLLQPTPAMICGGGPSM